MRKYILVLSFVFCIFNLKTQDFSGSVAKYTFNNGDGRDEVGENHAKIYGASLIEDRFGNKRSAFFLHGNYGSFINLGTSTDLKPIVGTISLWFNIARPESKGKGVKYNPLICVRAHSEDDYNEAFFAGYNVEDQTLGVCVSASEEHQVSIYTTNKTSLKRWHHLVMTYDYNYFSFYLDGVLENKIAKNFASVFLEGDSVLMGVRFTNKNTGLFNGSLDDIIIYNRVLSQNEITELYHTPNPARSPKIKIWIFVIVFSVLFILLLIWFIRQRINKLLNAEKEKNQLRNHWYEQENKVLAAQMDPHFIFNSLNTIQQFIITNENDKAQLYLSKFSRLMRKILESNTKDKFSLKEEIEIIEKYLEIESLRFNNVFDYKITIKDELNAEETFIPHFLIQPLVENAVWHGLLPKEGHKQLDIIFEKTDEKTLTCIIEDNGVGRKKNKSPETYAQKRSFAISFIEQRLLLMSKMYNRTFSIDVIDKIKRQESVGTKVIIRMPIIEL